jgi:hypothetical protein
MLVMKNILLVACVAILGMLLVGAGQAESIEAAVDNDCYPNPGTLTVLAGQTATNFAVQVLSAGVNCYTGTAFEDKGWFIAIGDANGARVYEYSYNVNQYGDGQKEEPYGPLSALSLNQGNYVIYVDGGKGAHVLADYDLI